MSKKPIFKIRETTPRDDRFRSNFERDGYQHLLSIINLNHADVGYEQERIKYHTTQSYTPDFTLYGENGKVIHLEFKGRFLPRDRGKLIRVVKCNKDIDIRLVFQVDQRLSKTSKKYYTQWAEDHNIPFAIKRVPEEWIKELYSNDKNPSSNS